MSKIKPIKAWAIVDKQSNEIVAIEIRESEPKSFTIGTWFFPMDDRRNYAVRVKLTPIITKRNKKI